MPRNTPSQLRLNTGVRIKLKTQFSFQNLVTFPYVSNNSVSPEMNRAVKASVWVTNGEARADLWTPLCSPFLAGGKGAGEEKHTNKSYRTEDTNETEEGRGQLEVLRGKKINAPVLRNHKPPPPGYHRTRLLGLSFSSKALTLVSAALLGLSTSI